MTQQKLKTNKKNNDIYTDIRKERTVFFRLGKFQIFTLERQSWRFQESQQTPWNGGLGGGTWQEMGCVGESQLGTSGWQPFETCAAEGDPY